MALLDKDYSVYSYDYSEEGTPLQGLGLLSWIMGSGATTSCGGASQQGSSRLITGRVVSAQMGLFQNEKETLEVKMKLVPVSSIKQSDYINSMNVYNTLSQIIPGNFDASSWSAYYQANQGWLQAAATGNAGSRPGGNGLYREPAAQAPVPHQPYPQAPVPASTQSHNQVQHYQHHQHQQSQQYQQPMHHQQPTQQAPPQHVAPQQPAVQPQVPQQHPTPQTVAQSPAPLQAIPPQSVAPSLLNQPVAAHPIIEENEVPKKKPRKRNPRPPAASNNGGRKKPAPSIPSAASTPATSQSDAYAPASQAPSESAFASPDLPRAVPVRQPYAHTPLADIPSVETSVNTPQAEVPGSSPPTDDLQHVGESPQQEDSPAPTSPILPGQNVNQQEIADRLDLSKELDALFRAQQQPEQKVKQTEERSVGQEPAQEQSQRQEHTQDGEETGVETAGQTPMPPPASQLTPDTSQTQPENIERTMEPYLAVTVQFTAAADDPFVTAAPSPLSELQLPSNTLLQGKPAKKKRKYVRKKGLMSDVVGPSEAGEEDSKGVKVQGLGGEEITQDAEAQVKSKKSKSMSGRADGEKKTGDEVEKQNRSQGPTSAKERIEAQLREALKEGNYKVSELTIRSRGLIVCRENAELLWKLWGH